MTMRIYLTGPCLRYIRPRITLPRLIIVCVIIYIYMLFATPKWPSLPPCPPVIGNQKQLQGTEVKIIRVPTGDIHNYSVDCAAIIAGDQQEIAKARNHRKCSPFEITPKEYVNMTQNCKHFRKVRGYDRYIISEEETDFPLAFTILTFEHVDQTERLLRAIYRPQNIYCIHVDRKSKEIIKKALEQIANCFDNVFLATELLEVKWSEFPVLEAEIHCLKDLVKYRGWKYLINLTGREFPLRTNWELVQVLKAYNGSNDIDGTLHKRPIIWTKYVWRNENWMTWTKKSPPPKGFLIAKGSTHIAATRGFVEYVVYNKSAQDLLEWMRDIRAPDEHYFPTLNHNPHLGIPGAYTGDPDLKRFQTRFKIWENAVEHCDGRWFRFICNFGVGDLSRVTKATELFANKFRVEFDPIAFDCMEQWYENRTKLFKHADFDIEFYKKQVWVKKHFHISQG